MRTRPIVTALALSVLLVACGDDGSDGTATTPAVTDTAATTTVSTPPVTPSTVAPTTTVAGLGQPAVWPAADVVFTTPEAAAADFVEQVLGVPPVLGDFMAGDSNSGEIEVFVEGAPDAPARSTLLMRRLGPQQGWFVLAAVSDAVTIDQPGQGSELTAGPISVDGDARGFERLVVVEAYVAGTTSQLDQQIAEGGGLEAPEPYAATVDLQGAAPGDTVIILVRGGVGLETDPGEFSAIAVTITG